MVHPGKADQRRDMRPWEKVWGLMSREFLSGSWFLMAVQNERARARAKPLSRDPLSQGST